MPRDPIHLFYQQGFSNMDGFNNVYSGPRIRAISIDGKIKWATLANSWLRSSDAPVKSFNIVEGYFFNEPPCYLHDFSTKIPIQPSSLLHALLLCDLYDVIHNYREMEWIGDI